VELRKIAMYPALTRTEMVMGCDRGLLTMLGAICTLLIVPAGAFAKNWGNVAAGIALLLAGYRLLVALGKYDPQAREVWGRANTYRSAYPAVGRCGAPRRAVRRWR